MNSCQCRGVTGNGKAKSEKREEKTAYDKSKHWEDERKKKYWRDEMKVSDATDR